MSAILRISTRCVVEDSCEVVSLELQRRASVTRSSIIAKGGSIECLGRRVETKLVSLLLPITRPEVVCRCTE